MSGEKTQERISFESSNTKLDQHNVNRIIEKKADKKNLFSDNKFNRGLELIPRGN
jgi:hypothetical protein